MLTQHIVHTSDRQELLEALAGMTADVKRLFVVHGHHSYVACGARDVIDDLCDVNDLVLSDFNDFTEYPKKSDVDRGVEVYKQASPDLIVAIGGGSVMDMAKLIRHYSQQRLKLVAIPTTAGTGAESTQFAVCYVDGVKHSISDEGILPDVAMLYPPFTYKNGGDLTACTGFDALAQAIESYWNIHATEVSDGYALKAIKLIYGLLPKHVLSPQERDDLMLGANYAGRAINITRTTVPHALSYTLTSSYGYPHGHAVALTFPFFLKYYLYGGRERYRGADYEQYMVKMNKLAALLGVDEDPFGRMRDYILSLGLGFDRQRDFDDEAVANGINLERAGNSPMTINSDVVRAAVESIRRIQN